MRQAAGKDPEGTLKLRAAQEGSHVIIEVPTTAPASPWKRCARRPSNAG